MACLSCLQCYAERREQTASSEGTWVRHFTHNSWLSARGGNTPALFTVTPFAGNVLHSVFGLFQCAAGGLPGTWTRSERRPILRHAKRLAKAIRTKVRSSCRQCGPPRDNARPTDGTADSELGAKFDSETQDHPLHSPNLAFSDFFYVLYVLK